ncbi:T9SS type A sorting domain-containing protein [Hymenobacter yonginensis]|uniref:T9SS type A sorting domain-containing protein n=1 Tax=Hymenobacter yonginensis TaxID=748197 RepID=A0ABY7PJS5_9BACT|nr:T9SS type A sorting domain-containing protein [Hymenobacter yonginensis]WBO83541.1 T9SS type A sorting domain-containing protein [Hymenobacter yonginensis]
MMRPLILLLLLLGLLTGCEAPTTEFDVFALPRPVNLARVLGPAPVLLGEQDTLALRLQFDAATGFTSFALAGDSADENWFTARAFRFRGLYYLVEEQPDSGYWVHAVRIRRGQVQGLSTGYHQMLDLSQDARQGRWPGLVRFRALSGDSMRLRFDRRQLRAFYAAEVDSFATYRIATAPAAKPGPASAHTTSTAQSISLYPNPASTTATVNFGEAAARQVQLYNEQGQLLQAYTAASSQLALPVADLPNGTYLVRVTEAGKARPATLRLLVAH